MKKVSRFHQYVKQVDEIDWASPWDGEYSETILESWKSEAHEFMEKQIGKLPPYVSYFVNSNIFAAKYYAAFHSNPDQCYAYSGFSTSSISEIVVNIEAEQVREQ
jgi:hypothetical protein